MGILACGIFSDNAEKEGFTLPSVERPQNGCPQSSPPPAPHPPEMKKSAPCPQLKGPTAAVAGSPAHLSPVRAAEVLTNGVQGAMGAGCCCGCPDQRASGLR